MHIPSVSRNRASAIDICIGNPPVEMAATRVLARYIGADRVLKELSPELEMSPNFKASFLL